MGPLTLHAVVAAVFAVDVSELTLPEMLIPQHNLTRFIRVGLSAEDGVMIWRRPRRILGVIPFGRREIRIPVNEIEAMRIQDVTLRWWRLPVPIAIVVAAALLTPWQVMVPLIIFGIWTAFVSFGPFMEAATSHGAVHRVAVCFGHKIDAELFIEAITGEPVAV